MLLKIQNSIFRTNSATKNFLDIFLFEILSNYKNATLDLTISRETDFRF